MDREDIKEGTMMFYRSIYINEEMVKNKMWKRTTRVTDSNCVGLGRRLLTSLYIAWPNSEWFFL